MAYDDRGNGIWTARQVAVIPTPLTATTGIIAGSGGAPAAARPYGVEPSLATQPRGSVQYDTAHTYTQTAHFDHAGRGTSIVLPLDPDWGEGAPPQVVGTMAFQRRGLPASASVGVGCTVDAEGALSCPGGFQQPVIAGIEYTRDGLPSRVTYGDDGGLSGVSRSPTVSETRYDERRRPVRMFATRSPTSTTADSLGAVSVPFDQQYAWDAASNLTDVFDHRDASEWPAGYRPQSVHIRHDALYHVISADFDYTHEGGARSPIDSSTDWRGAQAALHSLDPMEQVPPEMVPAIAPNRVASLTWSWDFLGNNTDWTDDASSFYERSIGGGTLPSDPMSSTRGIANGVDWDHQSGPLLRPSALYLATNLPTHAPASYTRTDGGGGWVEVGYGVSGNVVNMTAHGQCVPRPAADSCLIGTNAGLDYSRRMRFYMDCQWSCAEEQHYEYRWDELNRIAEARRWDRDEALATTSPMYGWPAHPTVRQRYRYDGGNVRIIKETLDPETPGEDGGPRGRVALYVYPGDFERRGLERDVYSSTYVPLSDFEGRGRTETQYLVAGARVVWQHSFGTEPLQDQDALANRRITVGVGDLLGTTSAVLDLVSGELLEASTYYPNGARETLRIPEGEPTLQVPYEPMGFTGKEADEEVGLVYFGERYLIPRIGRWASPDPLHVHASGGGEALNSYHYVSGNLLAARDPLGLESSDRVGAQSRVGGPNAGGSSGAGGSGSPAPATVPADRAQLLADLNYSRPSARDRPVPVPESQRTCAEVATYSVPALSAAEIVGDEPAQMRALGPNEPEVSVAEHLASEARRRDQIVGTVLNPARTLSYVVGIAVGRAHEDAALRTRPLAASDVLLPFTASAYPRVVPGPSPSIMSTIPRVAVGAPSPAAPTARVPTYGPWTHQINGVDGEADISSIMREGLRATQARPIQGGGTHARGTVFPFRLPEVGGRPTIEFYTLEPGVPNPGRGWMLFPRPNEGDLVPVIVTRIGHADGTLSILGPAFDL